MSKFKKSVNLQYAIFTSIFCLFFIIELFAHESRPLYIQITENTPNHYILKVNIPNSIAENNLPTIVFPTDFIEKKASNTLRMTTSGYLKTRQFESNSSSIKGKNFTIQFPKFNPSITSIVQVKLQNEVAQTYVLSPTEQQFVIPKSPSSWMVIYQYTQLGMEHIWVGIDHLLFLVCLLIITDFSKKLFWTITGFTLAHSVTLVASTLAWVQLPVQAIEACIALSIIFLCYEIIHHHESKTSLTYRYPVLVSSSFGLLHGFGFATVLNDIGLPPNHLFKALLFFNIGVEIGQLLFLISTLILQFFMLKFLINQYKHLSSIVLRISIYGMGILASFWFFERLF